MGTRSIIVIVLAIVCGLSAALGLNMVMARPQAPQAEVETVPVIVAKEAISRGRLVSAKMVELKAWPKSLAPQGALATLTDVEERAALQTIQAGEPLFEAKLAKKGAVGGMATLIPTGMRAYTIQTKTVASNVAGFVLPGNHVDVLLTFRSQGNDETGGGSTTTLLQKVEVMAVGRLIEPVGQQEMVDAQDVDSVTLLVTPGQVARLDLGQTLGTLSLSLRNPNDLAESETTMATIHDIRFGPKALVEPPAAEIAPATHLVPEPVPPAAESKPKPAKYVQSSIRTLRGLSWGEIRVVTPAKQPAESVQ